MVKKIAWFLGAVLTVVLLWPRHDQRGPDWDQLRQSVVQFEVRSSTTILGQHVSFGWTGSGFLVSPDGYIVTAAHVVDGVNDNEIAVRTWGAPGFVLKARVVYKNGTDDIAVVKVELPGYELPYLKLGDGEALKVGDEVYVMGHPLGLDWSAMATKLAAKRFIEQTIVPEGSGEIEAYVFQLMAPIASGVSGGPVVDKRGEVVAMAHNAYVSPGHAQINFAVPVEKIKWVMASLGLN